MKNKFCCEDFQWRYTTSDGMGLNIRVARLKDSYQTRGFFITEGYATDSPQVKYSRIHYCPFCGKKLLRFYKRNGNLENSKVEDFIK